MSLILAFKSFFKALKEPQKAEKFLSDAEEPQKPSGKDRSHLQLLSALQQAGRLIDFLKEDITGFSDAQVGAAVRQIHDGCRKSLEDLVTVRSVMDQSEGEKITVPAGYSASEIKIVGHVKGEPPYEGTLVHRGWKAHKLSLPKTFGEFSVEVIAPAEVEIK